MTRADVPLPRELAPGLFWLGACLEQRLGPTVLHACNSAFLVEGDDCSLLVEAGHPQDLAIVEAQLDALLARSGPPLRYLFATHQETPHSAGVGRILERHPDVVLCGDVHDYHLVFPAYADRFRPLAVGDALDLGGTEFAIVEAVIRDLPTTQWGFDTRRRALFPGDGFAYSHYHEAGHCGRTAEEVPELAVNEMTAVFAELALYWTQFTDMEPYVARLAQMVGPDLGVRLIAPTHGLPIADVPATVPKLLDGLRQD